MDGIVYTSESGFTKRYAELLSEMTGLPLCELNSSSSKDIAIGPDVIYLGWLMAGKIKGFSKARKKYNILAVCAVGMSSPGIQSADTLKAQNNINKIPFFYLQGGFNITKLHGMYHLMMKVIGKTVGKKLNSKESLTLEETEMLKMMKKGGDHVSRENLSEIISWLAIRSALKQNYPNEVCMNENYTKSR